MTIAAQKRPLPPKVAKMQARKRQKLGTTDVISTAIGPKSVLSTRPVELDSLRWNEVAMPDQMDDYEGFFGLEEIDGVDIVKGSDGRQVSYQVVDESRTYEDAAGLREKDLVASDDVAEDDEWNGIDDSNDVATIKEKPQKSKANKKQKAEAQQKTPAKLSKTPKHQAPGSGAEGPENIITTTAFDILGDADGEDDVDISAWKPLKLSPAVTEALSRLRFPRPTAIQSSAIPEILDGHDLIGKAPTGSGKTLAFGIPIYEHWLSLRQAEKVAQKAKVKSPMALIILPTRELAHQITTHLSALCSNNTEDSPSIATLTGGMSIQKQRRVLSQADIVIATPGRLWEIVSEGHGVLVALKAVKFLVLDEADRLLSEGHFKELEEVLTALNRSNTTIDINGISENGEHDPSPSSLPSSPTIPSAAASRQTLVFSATLSQTLHQKLSKRTFTPRNTSSSTTTEASMEYLLQKLSFRSPTPRFIDVNPSSQMATALREGILECPGIEKDLHLYTLLLYHPHHRTLVFANSISAVRRLVPFLTNLGLAALPLHSQMAQKARLRSLERFSAPDTSAAASNSQHGQPRALGARHTAPILVATDVASRGLDIPAVTLVVHYHLPRAAGTYVHRSGRTARAEAAGLSILLCGAEEVAGVRRLVTQVHSGGRKAAGSADGGEKTAVSKKRPLGALKTLSVDPRMVAALRPRAALSKRIADAEGAKERGRKEDEWVKAAAEELGVDDDDVAELLEGQGGGGKRGRGAGRMQRDKEARGLSKGEVAGLKAELRAMLKQRVNVGVSERYLTSNKGLDLEGLLSGGIAAEGAVLGDVNGLGLEDD